jgi:hypothetical protein
MRKISEARHVIEFKLWEIDAEAQYIRGELKDGLPCSVNKKQLLLAKTKQ